MPRGDQFTRQWKLVSLLSSRYGRTLSQLSSELGVAKRTVQRDISVLEQAGMPVQSEARNGTVFWHFMEGFSYRVPLALTLTEQMALYFSKDLFKPLQGTAIYESLGSAIQKIGSALPPQGFQLLRGFEKAIGSSMFGLKDYRRSKQVIADLTRAIFNKFTVGMEHRTPPHKRGIFREVDPYHLWYVNNGLYLIAHDHRSRELRTFAVERISSVKLTNRRFEIPADFDLEALKKSAFNLVYGEPQEVKIRFSADQAPYIEARTWHPSQKIEKQEDGSIVLTLHVADIWEVKRWLIGFGAEAEVVEPNQLRKALQEDCVKILAMNTTSIPGSFD